METLKENILTENSAGSEYSTIDNTRNKLPDTNDHLLNVEKNRHFFDSHADENRFDSSVLHKSFLNGYSHLAEEKNVISEISNSYGKIISSIGEDPNRLGLLKTPERAAKALFNFTKGYSLTLEGILFFIL